ncbi:hypothetical protein BDR03DRAFT_952895 [Suillus americanus]|nr:hypothetical protein BDR03DRAFT_952895 [Suillus americanus]
MFIFSWRSTRSAHTGNQQWGLDAGQHHRRWNMYLNILNIPHEWVLRRDYRESELKVKKIILPVFVMRFFKTFHEVPE